MRGEPKIRRSKNGCEIRYCEWYGIGIVYYYQSVVKVRKAGGTDEDIHCLATPEGETTLEKMADIIVGVKRQAFKVMVDYTKSLKEMIKAGQYDWVNNGITSDHFPITGSGQKEKEITLFHFNRGISSDNAVVEMEEAGYRPALVEELLALGAAEKELQKQFPINALGSLWQPPDGRRFVPSLDWGSGGRGLSLGWFEGDWVGSWRFAAVRNAS